MQAEGMACAKAQKHESMAVSETSDVTVINNMDEYVRGETCRAFL